MYPLPVVAIFSWQKPINAGIFQMEIAQWRTGNGASSASVFDIANKIDRSENFVFLNFNVFNRNVESKFDYIITHFTLNENTK